jgi:phosphotransferase system HPr (HPr) family protein
MAAIEVMLTLTNKVGLHARPASLWVQTAARFQSQITARYNGRSADSRRILEVLQLGAGAGAVLAVRAEGEDAEAALAALAALVESRFGESD